MKIEKWQEIKQVPEKLPKSPFPAWLSFILLGWFRRRSFNRQKIVAQAGIRTGLTVLEIGCGPGFFTETIAKNVGPQGLVIAQDVQRKMLEKLQRRMGSFPVKENIQLLLADAAKTELPSESIDVIFAVNVFEEIAKEGRVEQTAKEAYRLLKSGGHLYFGEHRVPEMRINKIFTALSQAGFQEENLAEKHFFYTAVFKKPV